MGVLSVARLVALGVRLRRFFHVNGQLTVRGVRRRYLLHVPDGLDPDSPVPLVVVIHGFMQSPAHQARMSRWDDLADAERFITVYPMGVGIPLHWPVHEPVAVSQGTRDQIDFLRALVETIQEEYAIDPDRIYACGMSNGGGVAAVLACEVPELFAAVGSVAGLYTHPPTPAADRPVPLIAFHGRLDRIVPFEGGVKRMRFAAPPVTEWLDAYARGCGCTTRTEARLGETLHRVDHTGGPGGVEVVSYVLDDGGHTWPGGIPLPEVITGPTSDAIDATRLIWDFFVRHPRRRSSATL